MSKYVHTAKPTCWIKATLQLSSEKEGFRRPECDPQRTFRTTHLELEPAIALSDVCSHSRVCVLGAAARLVGGHHRAQGPLDVVQLLHVVEADAQQLALEPRQVVFLALQGAGAGGWQTGSSSDQTQMS